MHSQMEKHAKEHFFANLSDLDLIADDECDEQSDDDNEPPLVGVALSEANTLLMTQSNKGTTLVDDCEAELILEQAPPVVRRPARHPFLDLDAIWEGPKERLGVKVTKTRQKKESINVSEDQKIFRGLTFYFVPNNDISPVRRFRIEKAIAHGATQAHAWSDLVTHVIVDNGQGIREVARAIKMDKIAASVQIVQINWLTESLGFMNLRNPHASRFRVETKGFDSELYGQSNPPRKIHSTSVLSVLSSTKDSSGRSCQGLNSRENKPETHIEFREKKQLKVDSSTEENEKEFQQTVNTVKAFNHLPLDSDETSDDESAASLVNIQQDLRSSNKKSSCTDIDMFKKFSGFACMQPHGSNNQNPNAPTIEILKEMATYYAEIGDHWRTTSYRRCIAILWKQSSLIQTKEAALALPGVGLRLAAKIEEIVLTGRLRCLENSVCSPEAQLLKLFMGIYQVGYQLASKWIAQGYRTLEDLRAHVDLTANQKVGIDRYYDFQQRIPRAEVGDHAAVIQQTLGEIDKQLQLTIGGSYRRGEPDCGDIDIMITKKDSGIEHIRALVLELLIPRLVQKGFIKIALTTSLSKNQVSKWHGASAIPGSSIWRRLDLLLVPWAEYGSSLIYFTGNDVFNRSLRLLAKRKKMRLNQHGLYCNVIRGVGGKRLNTGSLLDGHDEVRIFEILGVPYRPPNERQC